MHDSTSTPGAAGSDFISFPEVITFISGMNTIKHIFFFLLITATLLVLMLLPYIPGDYDYFAVGLSIIVQVSTLLFC